MPTTRKPARPSSARKLDSEPTAYIVRITGWNRLWGFGVAPRNPDIPSPPYSNWGTLTLYGEVCHPQNFKYPRAEIALSDERDLVTAQNPPSILGLLEARGDLLRIYASIPADTMSELATLAASGRLKSGMIHGTALLRRRGTVRSIELSTQYGPDDW